MCLPISTMFNNAHHKGTIVYYINPQIPLTDSGSILCCSRNAENSTSRSGWNKYKKSCSYNNEHKNFWGPKNTAAHMFFVKTTARL